MFSQLVNKKKSLFSAFILSAACLASANVLASDDDHSSVGTYTDGCAMLPLVDSMLSGIPNTDVCVDAPVALTKAKVVFDMNSNALDPKGRHTGLRHMMMLATAMKARINAGLLDPSRVSVIGVMHGDGLSLAVDNATSPINPKTKGLIESIFALQKAGVNISLEVCGVTMHGKGLNNADLYKSDNGVIHVNQGAIGRIIDLEQHDYALIKE